MSLMPYYFQFILFHRFSCSRGGSMNAYGTITFDKCFTNDHKIFDPNNGIGKLTNSQKKSVRKSKTSMQHCKIRVMPFPICFKFLPLQ